MPSQTYVGGDAVGPLTAGGERHVAAPAWRIMLRWGVDLLVLLVGGVVVGFVGFGVLVETVSEEAGGAGLVGGYLLWAVGYGALTGRARSLGDRLAGVRRLRLRDGSSVGAAWWAFRTVLTAVTWPVVAVVAVVGPLTGPGGIDQGGRLARDVVVLHRGT